jgi:hypothetical protein
VTVDEFLEYLDGRGIVYVDPDLVEDALKDLGSTLEADIELGTE